ncbi:hypothetical protein NBT05_05530 [Aquimarina sp. ERC-38]|uniref:hypothetical protein n=1 Tax=Aquimarina sp. ERC-38 TaxID=2949996 RepID=UPI002246E982|nr:hypothetical protein [Aquimarina sp. ERC-38]UZO81925.1 hypothetical protein NBT05_05530 [Aquimarina sp. ERC-38]
MNSQISILGTGWLGLPLAEALISKGYLIKCSTTTSERLEQLKAADLQPYMVQLTELGVSGNIEGFLGGSDTLIINIPPGLRKHPNSNFVLKIKQLLPYLENSTIQKLIFISSTSVFKDELHFPIITQKSQPNGTSITAKQLIAVEELLKNLSPIRTSILRFGGLYDERRHPATMIAKRGIISNPLAPVNLIHRIDCIGIITQILELEKYNLRLNAAAPEHPTKKDYYQRICKEIGLPLASAAENEPSVGKIIDSSFLEKELQYTFKMKL